MSIHNYIRKFIILVSLFTATQVKANMLSDYVNENIYNSDKGEKLEVTAAAGVGNQINSLRVGGMDLETTNRNFMILAANVNQKLDFHLTIPFKDPQEARTARVDSDVQRYDTSYKITDHYQVAAYYLKNRGYYTEDHATHTFSKMQNLSFDQAAVNFIYAANDTHQSVFFDPILTKKSTDSSSFIYSAGYSRSTAGHLNELNTLSNSKTVINTTGVNTATFDTVRAQIIYSKNWFWTHWYAMSAIGLEGGLHYVQKKYDADQNKSNSDSSLAATLSLSFGYVWEKLAFGSFTRVTSTEYRIDSINLNSNLGVTGAYLSYQF
jgi:hypothetical protein